MVHRFFSLPKIYQSIPQNCTARKLAHSPTDVRSGHDGDGPFLPIAIPGNLVRMLHQTSELFSVQTSLMVLEQPLSTLLSMYPMLLRTHRQSEAAVLLWPSICPCQLHERTQVVERPEAKDEQRTETCVVGVLSMARRKGSQGM